MLTNGVDLGRDPLQTQVSPESCWTTVNIVEAIPGLLTPLSWTFWYPAMERAVRRSHYDSGTLPRSLLAVPTDPSLRFQAAFYGQGALNPDSARLLGDLTPGADGAALEEQILGFARDLPSRSTNKRLPFVGTRLPAQLATITRRSRELLATTREWWTREVVQAGAVPKDPAALLLDARRRFEAIITVHTTATSAGFVASMLIGKLVERAGDPGLGPALTTGVGNYEETAMMAALHECTLGNRTIESFVATFGYYGVDEGQLHSTSWREDPSILDPLLERYRALPGEGTPAAAAARRAAVNAAARARLVAALPATSRPLAGLAGRMATSFLPLRETGKAAFLMTIDAARFAARSIGRDLATAGRLEDVEDVFLLTVDEAASGAWDADLLAFRRERQQAYAGITLPTWWYGTPEPVQVETAGAPRPGRVAHRHRRVGGRRHRHGARRQGPHGRARRRAGRDHRLPDDRPVVVGGVPRHRRRRRRRREPDEPCVVRRARARAAVRRRDRPRHRPARHGDDGAHRRHRRHGRGPRRMTGHAEELWEIEQIKQLKARYFRLMDTKQWDDWADVFTPDCTFDYPDGAIAWTGRDRIVAECRADPRGSVTAHHGHMPEITLTGPTTATGIWAMEDQVEFTSPSGGADDDGAPGDGAPDVRGFHGTGHYHEDYEKGTDGRWRIARLLLTRVRVDYV